MPQPIPLTSNELEELAIKYGTPYQLYDQKLIENNCTHLLSKFNRIFPDFQQFYAVKALPNPVIVQILVNTGCGLDCSSSAELYLAKKLNVPPEKVIFTSNYTSKNDLAIAFDQGVIINLDDISLIDSLVEIRGKCSEIICFRLNPGIGKTDSETISNVLGGPDAKFGVPSFQIVEAYRKAKNYGAKRFGIHMMTGSCVMDADYWKETVGIVFEFMNIGGGLGIPYHFNQKPVDIDNIILLLKETFTDLSIKHPTVNMPRLCMENGRYMTGPYGWLVSRCQAIKSSYQIYYGLDASMAHLMRPGMYGAYHEISIPAKENDSNKVEANVVGNLCENNDWFAKQRLLPKASVGDLFVIYDTGAHSHSMGFQYNGKLRAPEILLQDDNNKKKDILIRKRETYDSLYGNCIIPEGIIAGEDAVRNGDP